jgi:hypothetical protein
LNGGGGNLGIDLGREWINGESLQRKELWDCWVKIYFENERVDRLCENINAKYRI